MKAFVFGLIGVLWAGVASAQAICPTGPTSATLSSQTTPKVIWCSPQSNTVTGANVYGLPTTKIPVNGVVALGGPYGDGQIQYQGTIPPQPKGNYSVTVKAVNLVITGDPTQGLQESGASAPFALSVVDPNPPPAAPSNVYLK